MTDRLAPSAEQGGESSPLKRNSPPGTDPRAPRRLPGLALAAVWKWGWLPALLCLMSAVSGYAQGQGWIGTPVEAKRLVQKAVLYLQDQGPEKALKEFNRPNGMFQWRDLYVFACNPAGVVAAHPDARLIGRSMCEVPDSQGKLFWKEIVLLANSRGSGWVDYLYLDRISGQEAFKITYFEKVGDLIVCSGAYLP